MQRKGKDAEEGQGCRVVLGLARGGWGGEVGVAGSGDGSWPQVFSRSHPHLFPPSSLLPRLPSPPHLLSPSPLPQAPKWAANVRFVLVDVEPSPRDSDLAAATLVGDAAASLRVLLMDLRSSRVQTDRLGVRRGVRVSYR